MGSRRWKEAPIARSHALLLLSKSTVPSSEGQTQGFEEVIHSENRVVLDATERNTRIGGQQLASHVLMVFMLFYLLRQQ